jgi:hypothetical protein
MPSIVGSWVLLPLFADTYSYTLTSSICTCNILLLTRCATHKRYSHPHSTFHHPCQSLISFTIQWTSKTHTICLPLHRKCERNTSKEPKPHRYRCSKRQQLELTWSKAQSGSVNPQCRGLPRTLPEPCS